MRKRRGFVQLAILHLLEEESMHGYQIMKQLEERSNGLYQASAGTVYPALQELFDEESILLRDEETDKKVYSINGNGEKRLKEYADKEEGDFWINWNKRLVWRNSQESVALKETIHQWENELRDTIRYVRKNPSSTEELILLIQESTERLKKIVR